MPKAFEIEMQSAPLMGAENKSLEWVAIITGHSVSYGFPALEADIILSVYEIRVEWGEPIEITRGFEYDDFRK